MNSLEITRESQFHICQEGRGIHQIPNESLCSCKEDIHPKSDIGYMLHFFRLESWIISIFTMVSMISLNYLHISSNQNDPLKDLKDNVDSANKEVAGQK